MANCGINFFFIIYYFSLVKAAMKAPCIFKLRKNCLTGIDQCALRNGVIKTPQFLHIDRSIYDCKLRKEKKYIPSAQRISPPTSKLVA